MVKIEIEFGLPFMILDLEYKFQMICLRRTQVIEWRPNARCSDMGKLYANVQWHVGSNYFGKMICRLTA